MVNRREFMSRFPWVAALGLPAEKAKEPCGALVCRWYDGSHGQWELRIGKAVELDMLQNYGATLAGTLWIYTATEPYKYTFRFGRLFYHFQAGSLPEAKKLAEEWLRPLRVEVERLAFA